MTGERLVFHKTSRDTGGEYRLVETFVEQGGFVAQAHVHRFQTETFEAVEGVLSLKADREETELAPGPSARSPPASRTRSGTRPTTRSASSARCGPRCSSRR